MRFFTPLTLLTSSLSLVLASAPHQIPLKMSTSAAHHPFYPKHGLALQITERLQKTPLTLAKVDIPQTLAPNELLLKVIAAAQNPVDSKFIDYDRIPSFPTTVGGDVAGIVLAVGADVKDFKAGDNVASFLTRSDSRHAGYQQYTIAIASTSFKFPKHISFEEASTIPLAFATAVGLVFTDLQIPIPPKGSTLPLPRNSHPPILVWGGSGSVGAYAIQLAKLAGYGVVATASPANFEYVKSLGADVVVDYHDSEKAVEEIKKATDGKLSLVADTTSEHGSTALAVRAFGPDGGIISTVLPVDDSAKNGRKDIEILATGAKIVFDPTQPKYLDAYRFIVEALDQKVFQPNRVEVIPGGLLGVDEGFKRQREHTISAVKLVYRVLDTPGIEKSDA